MIKYVCVCVPSHFTSLVEEDAHVLQAPPPCLRQLRVDEHEGRRRDPGVQEEAPGHGDPEVWRKLVSNGWVQAVFRTSTIYSLRLNRWILTRF